MRRLVVVLLLALGATPEVLAQGRPRRKEPPSAEELRGIAQRGQLLAQYDRVAWEATDAVLLRQPSGDRVRNYIPQRTDDVWAVAFGRLSAAQDAFLVAYEARLTRGDSAFRVTEYAPARADTGYFLRAARAVELARQAFGDVGRPYNVAVIPAHAGEWWVYLYPAQTRPDVWPLGADERFLVSADGRRLVARRRMHKAVIEYSAPSDQRVETYTHAAILDDVPEDTDVFAVLARRPRAPELVVTNAFVYRIDVDGSITCLGRREEVLGPERPPG